MAGHFSLSKINEPTVFKTIEDIKDLLVSKGDYFKDFEKYKVKDFEVMKLSNDYVAFPSKEVAFSVGPLTLEDDYGVDQWLAKDCSLEVHLTVSMYKNQIRTKIKNIFWVV